MPIYEYECATCHKVTEVQQKMTEPPLKRCDACGTDTLEKLISRTSFQLKGGGWYSDLYSSTSGGKKASDSGTAGAAFSSPAASSESSSAPKADAPAAAPAKKADAPSA